MAGPRVRAFRTYGDSASLRASLSEFASTGGGFVSSLAPLAQGRVAGLCHDVVGLKPLPFDKIVARFLMLAGKEMRVLADPVQELEALRHACRALPPESPFYACREYPGFVRRLRATVAELRSWRLGSSALIELAEKAEPGLGGKLQSLAFLDQDLRKGLAAAGRELESDWVERCLASNLGEASGGRLWIYSGSEFCPLLADWVRWVALNGIELWLVADGHGGVPSLFQGAGRMLEAVGAQAKFVGGANGLAEGLFAEQVGLDPGVGVRIVSTSDPLAEAEWALRTIAEEHKGGAGWEKAAIYVRNPDDYGPLLEIAASRLGVPLKLSRKEPLEANPFIRFTLCYLSACADDTPAALKKLSDSSYLGLGREAADLCRRAINISLSEEDPWHGLGERLSADNPADAWLWDAIRLHMKAGLGPISPREWADEASELLEGSWLAQSLDEKRPTAKRDAAAKSAFVHAMEQHADFAEHSGIGADLGSFLESLEAIAGQTSYFHPAAEDGLPVHSAGYGLGQADVLCVLGMIEGAFPRRRSEDPILSDFERAALGELRPSLPKLPNSHDHARAERDELVRVCAAAGKEVVFFYPQVGDDRDNTPAFYLTEIRRVGHRKFATDIPSARLAPPADECLFEADQELRAALEGGRAFPPEAEVATELAKECVSGIPEEGLSPSELRDALQCPFKFEFQRRLKLDAGTRISRWHRIRYLPESAGLPLASTPEEASEALERALESHLEEMAYEVEPSERKLYEAGGRREIRGWVEREFLARDLWRKSEAQLQTGVPFGEAGTAGELPLKGEPIKIRGRLASVGDLGEIAVGVLYGSKNFGAKGGLERMEDPEVLELGIHLWSLCKRRGSVGLEVDTTAGERLLLLLPRPLDSDIPSRVEKGLRVVELGEKQEFYKRVKELLCTAVEHIRSGDVSVRPGDHCDHCDCGELCRRAQGYSEAPDPFQTEGSIGD